MLTGPRRVRACGHTRGYADVVDAQRADVARARARVAVVATAEKDKQIMELEGELRVAQKELKAAKDAIEKLKQERDKLKAVRDYVFRRSHVRTRRGGGVGSFLVLFHHFRTASHGAVVAWSSFPRRPRRLPALSLAGSE